MSLVQLTLRPPPHVDFVTGYPGIPPNGADRPQAAVKGALEIRVPAQGVKAQWVKVELRKVEILPGGGTGNTFYDVVGPGTVTLWTSGGAEYELLHARDFPFSIRIPEAVPPSLQLEQRAGIHYELVATVCTKGKRSFFRKRKNAVASTTASVIIDKHDLHSTWPVYCQQESRQINQDGIKLTVERNQSCYGPGDRMAVTATIKSESAHTVMLRSFEILLKETVSFRGQIFVDGRKGEPLTKSTMVSENRFQVNTPMYAGMQATQDLFCMLSATHTNTTLSAARHIDITYALVVKAHLGAGMPLVMELPVIVSNWQRSVSSEAMKRIGPAPGLSVILTPGASGVSPLTQQPITRVEPIPAGGTSTTQNRPTKDGYGNSRQNTYNTYPAAASSAQPDDISGTSRRPAHQVSDSQSSMRNADEFGGWPSRQGGATRPAVGAESQSDPAWISAADEKKAKQRYEDARARVERIQGGVTTSSPPPPAAAPVAPPVTQIVAPQPKPASSSNAASWPTAEEEKLRLFQNAQAAVAKTQGYEAAPVAVDPTAASASTHSKQPSAAALMYSQAVSAMRNDQTTTTKQQAQSSSSARAPAPAKIVTPPPVKPGRVPGYLTAEEEKAALRRYENAKRAVDRVQNVEYYEQEPEAGTSSLVPYDSLYPPGPPAASAAPAQSIPVNDLPPPFEAGPPLTAPQQLSEKERLRRAYEVQDAAVSRQNTASTAHVPAAIAPPPQNASPPPFSTGSSTYTSAAAEKEALRRRLEAQEAGGAAPNNWQTVTPPQTPPRSNSDSAPSSAVRNRPTPLPPAAAGSGSGQRILTAAEEKAMLRARYEAQESGAGSGGPPPPMYANGFGNSAGSSNGVAPSTYSGLSYASTAPSSPPPLRPRPPRDYIKETQEEDERVSRMTMNGMQDEF
ncbi:hypothetical protein JOM56_003109 [Amanita muscaria]